MLDARAAMTTPAKDPNLVDEICFLQKVLFLLGYKDILRYTNHTYEIVLIHPGHISR